MKSLNHRQCNICGETKKLHFLQKISYALPEIHKIQSSYDVLCCENCGFCFGDIFATEEDYNIYYTNYNTYSSSLIDTSENNLNREVIFEQIQECVSHESKILDIGFGNAELLKGLKMKGFFRLYGLDPSAASVEIANQMGIFAKKGSVENAKNLIQEKMDMIMLTGVLEHLLDPNHSIEKITELIKPEGYVFITVPNCKNLFFDNLPIANHFNQEHINYFSEISLCNLMSKNGFDLDWIVAEPEYIDIFAIFKYREELQKSNHVNIVDDITEVAIKNYFINRVNETKKQDKTILELIESQEKILIWGTGAFTMSLLSNSKLADCNVLAFIDNDALKWGLDIEGYSIIPPNKISEFEEATAILICCIRPKETIIKQIQDMGISKKIICM